LRFRSSKNSSNNSLEINGRFFRNMTMTNESIVPASIVGCHCSSGILENSENSERRLVRKNLASFYSDLKAFVFDNAKFKL
jgi:hypothetical protein